MSLVLEKTSDNTENTKVKQRDIFQSRRSFKPFEYDIVKFKEAMQHSFWLVSEFDFTGDIQDFKVRLNDSERNAVKNTLLAISQIEVAVKKFWGKIGDRFPKAEFDQVGGTFAESEIRHSDAYSHLLQILGLNEEFESILEVPAIKNRVEVLSECLSTVNSKSNKEYTLSLALFSIFIENVSLFSQFAIIKSFTKYKNHLQKIDNVVQATQKEENIHALFGMQVINYIRQENPEWFDEDFYDKIYSACYISYEAECQVIDWIFEQGELDFLSKETLQEFIKSRFNESLQQIGGQPMFKINEDVLEKISWMDEEVLGEMSTDFFVNRPVTYSKKQKPVTCEDLFD